MIGEIGVGGHRPRAGGKVFVHGEYWNAVAPARRAAGARVRVTAIDQLKLTVEPVHESIGG